MLYTTYFAKMKDIPDNCLKLIITRFPPKWLDIDKYPNTHIVKSLSPSNELLLKYKRNNDWDWYVEEFEKEMRALSMRRMFMHMTPFLKQRGDIYLICYEKDYTRCHRSLLGQYFADQGIEWKEL